MAEADSIIMEEVLGIYNLSFEASIQVTFAASSLIVQ